MEIDITDFFNNEDPSDYSASRAELGDNASKITWNAAKDRAASPPVMLDDDAKLAALRDHTRGFGAWEDSEIDAWDAVECNALFIQLISGDMREGGLYGGMTEAEWATYAKDSEAGRVSSRIFRGDIPGHEGFGRVYYYLGD